MNKLYLLLMMLTSGACIYGQQITFKLTDEIGASLPFAKVEILSVEDSAFQNALTDVEGTLRVEVKKYGEYAIRISMVGYEPLTRNISVSKVKTDLGLLKMVPSVKELKEITVTGQKSQIEFSGEKKVYNIALMSTAGSTLMDAMEKIPSMQVDQDRNVSFRGNSGLQILIDGKETNASAKEILESMPASSVDKLEIISNPNARFDAAGSGAVINIVTKKSSASGWSGVLAAGTGTWAKYSGSAFVAYKKDKLSFSLSASYRHDNNKGINSGYRKNFLTDTIFTYILNGQSINKSNNQSYRASFDYAFNNLNSVAFSANTSINSMPSSGRNTYTFFDAGDNFDRAYSQYTHQNNKMRMIGSSISYQYKNEVKGLRLSTGVTFNYAFGKNLQYQHQLDSAIGGETTEASLLQRFTSANNNMKSSFNFDFEKSLSKNHSIEAGLKIGTKNIESQNGQYHFDNLNQEWLNDFADSNLFTYPEQVIAFYTIVKNRNQKLLYQIGCRFEHTLTQPALESVNQSFVNRYFNVFPSFNLSYKFEKDNQVAFSFSKKIERPDIFQLNPYVNATDPYNVMTGNPYLMAELAYKTELEYLKYFKNASINVAMFNTTKTNNISRIRSVDNATGYSILSFINYKQSVNTGIEVNTEFNKYKWWTSTLSGSVFHSYVNVVNYRPGLSNQGVSWNATFINDFILPNSTSLQLYQMYRGPGFVGQGRRAASYIVDVTARKGFFDNQLSVSLKLSDLFNQSRFRIIASDYNFDQDFTFKRQSRELYLSVSYRIGMKNTGNKKQTRETGGAMEGNENNFGEGM